VTTPFSLSRSQAPLPSSALLSEILLPAQRSRTATRIFFFFLESLASSFSFPLSSLLPLSLDGSDLSLNVQDELPPHFLAKPNRGVSELGLLEHLPSAKFIFGRTTLNFSSRRPAPRYNGLFFLPPTSKGETDAPPIAAAGAFLIFAFLVIDS